ncbi:TetR/AcrR family transcriptional regulator [Streptomyces glaucosporus]|uniref:TetR/AcrR family transcriptional regulator n=1 Tax=Streptomyces glaucosporus TaxID=284044 RepID=A0ABN3HKD3_9ACTN
MAGALLRVVEAEGLEAASIPRIARELGATTGLVQTYFRSKDELLLFAVRHLGELTNARIAAVLEDHRRAGLKEQLLLALGVLTGADEGTGSEARIWLAFLARAAFHPALRELHAAGAREIRDRCRETLAHARRLGLLPPDRDVEAEALALAAFADGLAVQRAVEPELMSAERVRDLLRRYLDRLIDDEPDPHQGEHR